MKKRKFKTGGDTGDYMADIRRRAAEYAKMADKAGGTEETEEQKAFIRKQAGREDYGRSKPAPKPEPKKATPKSKPDAVTNELIGKFRQQTEDEVSRQKLFDNVENRAILESDKQVADRKKQDDAMPAEDSAARRSSQGGRGMTRPNEADIPYETTPPARQQKSFGSRVLDSLTQGGAGDIRNMLGSAAPTVARGSKSIADIYKTMREGKRRAALEKAGKPTGRRNADVERMESEAPAPITPKMPRRQESLGPRDLDELRMSGEGMGFKKGGKTKKYAQGGSVSARADGIAKRGRTNCKVY
jgi:hypothetical protein